jgi:hypothetical protein
VVLVVGASLPTLAVLFPFGQFRDMCLSWWHLKQAPCSRRVAFLASVSFVNGARLVIWPVSIFIVSGSQG